MTTALVTYEKVGDCGIFAVDPRQWTASIENYDWRVSGGAICLAIEPDLDEPEAENENAPSQA